MRRLAATRLFPASGGFIAGDVAKIVRFARMGCTNRIFLHIVVAAKRREQFDQCIEQIGSFDPMPNERNEKLVACNFERLAYWIGQGVAVSRPVAELLGIAGFFPVHPRTYMNAWRNRRTALEKAEADKKLEEEKVATDKTSSENLSHASTST